MNKYYIRLKKSIVEYETISVDADCIAMACYEGQDFIVKNHQTARLSEFESIEMVSVEKDEEYSL